MAGGAVVFLCMYLMLHMVFNRLHQRIVSDIHPSIVMYAAIWVRQVGRITNITRAP